MGAIEIKAGATVASDWFDALDRIAVQLPNVGLRAVVHGGSRRQSRRNGEAVPFFTLGELLNRLDGREEGA